MPNYNSTERRLTCNRIYRYLMSYHLEKFTGKVKVNCQPNFSWNFYFSEGNLIWANGGNSPWKRWERQFYSATGEFPTSTQMDENLECWNCTEFRKLIDSNALSQEQIKMIIRGTLEEVLFDVVRSFEATLYQNFQESRTLLSLSQLMESEDNMVVEAEVGVKPDPYYELPDHLFPSLKELQETTYNTWQQWIKILLSNH